VYIFAWIAHNNTARYLTLEEVKTMFGKNKQNARRANTTKRTSKATEAGSEMNSQSAKKSSSKKTTTSCSK